MKKQAKTIVALWHTGGKGKTTTVREIAKTLLALYPNCTPLYPKPPVVPETGDFRLVLEIKGTIIGLESQGDPKTKLKQRLEVLITEFKCDLIFCTTRSRGETVRAVEQVAQAHDFEQIWTSTYQTRTEHSLVNSLKAKHMVELVEGLGLV
jgi:hypothetical protein